jgi:LPLT family lysophospholipid transporter-like MFS transporter
MWALLCAQFLSAFGDNALLIAAIALLKSMQAAQQIPYVQEGFVLPFILLAPFAGPFADALPKGRVMLIGNGIKLAGAALMLAGFNPIACYLIVGIGATVYSPAKYGILTQMFGEERLVKANGMLEGSTIVAILLGVVAGGYLADHALRLALAGVMLLYAVAIAATLLIPRLAPEHTLNEIRPLALLGEFLHSIKTLMLRSDTRMSLLGTSLFWGTGATLRLMLFAWVPVALLITDNQMPANMMGVVSVGIVIGAALAAWLVKLDKVHRAYAGGLLLGPVILLLSGQTGLMPSLILLALLGACGGFFVVPLNALLQERGHQSVGAGRVLAIQNLFENLAMLLLVGGYGLSESLPIKHSVTGFGALVLVGMTALAWASLRRNANAKT